MRIGYVDERKQSALEILELELAQVRSSEQGFALLLIGLEQCRALSDALGYSFGEEVLHLGAQRIAATLRGPDTLIALSNDEFVVLLNSSLPQEESGIVAQRLLDQLQRPYAIRGEVANVRACIGIVTGTESGLEAELLLNRAGIALRSARASGPGKFRFFNLAMEERIKTRYALTAALRQAISLDQFEVHYQPQVSMKTRQPTGFEALLRWHHPAMGMISPAEFIPIAEEIGLIPTIGDWVLRTACRQAALLAGDIVMAVNASPLQLRGGDYVNSVERALAGAGLPPGRLEIEITEGILLEPTRGVLKTLDDLHAAGVRLAIDDFGTGYSSLGQLAQLPFDTIKIDRSLVGPSVQQRAIVRSIVALGDGLGMSVIAEGLETETDYEHARADGCLSGQGYLLGKATPAHQIGELLARLGREASRLQLDRCRRVTLRPKDGRSGTKNHHRGH
jgi:diguanylate cyclase (GGDEF)-like protein